MEYRELFVDKSKTLIINTELAIILGDLNEAIVLNQLNYWLEINKKAEKNFKDDNYWVFNTYTDWKNNDFPYWSEKTIQRVFTRLEKKGVVKSANYNQYAFDKTKWYTIDYKFLEKLVKDYRSREDKVTEPQDKLSRREGQNDRAIPENTNRDYNPETTDKDLRFVNDLSLQENTGNIYTPDSANLGEPSADHEALKNFSNETELKTQVDYVVDLVTDCVPYEKQMVSNDIQLLIEEYRKQSALNKIPVRKITPKSMIGIVYGYTNPPENMGDAGIDDYVAMLKEYFKTDFGARGRYKGKITRSLEHFMSDGIRSRLYERCRQNE